MIPVRRLPAAAVCLAAVLLGRDAPAAERLPLPDAPVRLVIPDAVAFDAALSGSFRAAATGEIGADDPLLTAWRQSPVGSKLEAEWSKLSSDLPWTWTQIRALQPRALGVALVSTGSLEIVLVVDTPLATLPLGLPAGRTKAHAGVAYSLVSPGTGDPGGSDQRRAGLAWARHQGLLLVATSEKALLAAIDEALAGRGVSAFLPGLASLELDLDRLREDRYFVREFAWGTPGDAGRVHAALRVEAGRLVEVREGRGARRAPALVFDKDAAAAGWEPEAEGFAFALRSGLLEPLPTLAERPVPPLAPLPATAGEASDRYLVRLDRPASQPGAQWEEGDLAAWREIAARRPAAGWGFRVDRAGERAIVFAWPQSEQPALERACRETLARRGGRVVDGRDGDTLELRLGPGLPALAIRRAGEFVWIGSSARAVSGLAAPQPAGDLVRWARVDLAAARAEAGRWGRAEGPAAPERVRPFSDRVLGLLGWMPSVTAIAVERRQGDGGWTERVVFESR
jgi:hypothetical protein